MKVRGYLAILVAAVGIACEHAATPTAPSSVSGDAAPTWPEIDRWLAKTVQ
jgi:hypothetical protein